MAAFCGFFPWCSPETFWNLTVDEHAALAEVMDRAGRDS